MGRPKGSDVIDDFQLNVFCFFYWKEMADLVRL